MADSKISQLTALTAVDVASADVLPIVDTSATTTKKVTAANLATYVAGTSDITTPLAAKAPIASPTFTGTVTIPAGASIDGYLTTSTAAGTYETITNVAAKAPLASPALTGTPTAPTAAVSTSTTQVATTAFVMNAKEDDQFILAMAIF